MCCSPAHIFTLFYFSLVHDTSLLELSRCFSAESQTIMVATYLLALPVSAHLKGNYRLELLSAGGEM